MEMEPAIVRGNASEIVALATENGNRAGVDSLISSETALEAGKFLAKQYGTVVAISGETDYVSPAVCEKLLFPASPLNLLFSCPLMLPI